MNDNDLINNGFFARKSGNGSAYNFDIEPLINNFTFYDFFAEAERGKKDLKDYGGFIIITNKQYIIGYNAGFGAGTHLSSYARAMKDMFGGGIINTQQEAFKLSASCARNYITARICYEYVGNDNNGRPIYSGVLNFILGDSYKITSEQFANFENFYNEYNEELKYIIAKYGVNMFCVRFGYLDKQGKLKYNESDSLDYLYKYLSNNIDESKIILEESNIIGKKNKKF